MGSNDRFRERRKRKEKRQKEFRQPKAGSYLIVTEGSETERNYFNGIKSDIEKTPGGRVDIAYVEKPSIAVRGVGRGTSSLVKETAGIVKHAKVLYKNIWVVMDKDEYTDFDRAIKEAEKNGYNATWSNACFEYWLCLNFEYSISALTRYDWQQKLDQLFIKHRLSEEGYSKNDPKIYELLKNVGGPESGIKNAEKVMSDFTRDRTPCSQKDPGTTVHILVKELVSYIKEK